MSEIEKDLRKKIHLMELRQYSLDTLISEILNLIKVK